MTWKSLPPEPGDTPSITVADSLARVAKKLGAAHPKAMTAVFENWGEIVGSEIASHTQPESLVDGVLTVSVDDQRWMTQLKWMTSQIAVRLNDAVQAESVKRVEVRLQRPDYRK